MSTRVMTYSVHSIRLTCRRFRPRKPMILGSLIVGGSILLLMSTNLMLGTYNILAIVAYTLFGLCLAFYATPSTDAALSNLPSDQAGSGSGIYKMEIGRAHV